MKPTELKPLLVNGRTAAKLLGVSVQIVNSLRMTGRIEAVPLNPEAKNPFWLYQYESLERFAKGIKSEHANTAS